MKQILSSLYLNDVGNYLGDGPISSDIGIVILQPSKGTHWVVFINENICDSNGFAPLNKVSRSAKKRHCLFSENKIQVLTGRRDSYCSVYSMHIDLFI